MGKKKQRKSQSNPAQRHSFSTIITLVTGVYFVTVILYIFCLLSLDPILIDVKTKPTAPLIGLICLYYVLPIILAFVFGTLFRPFWRNFRNVLFPIFFIALLYSFIVFMLRNIYSDPRREDRQQASLANLRISSVQHDFLDENSDQRTDKVELTFRFDLTDFPPGRYYIRGFLESTSSTAVEQKIGEFIVPFTSDSSKSGVGHFTFDLPSMTGIRQPQEYGVNIQLLRVKEITTKEQRILAWARWAPFFRTTSWDGHDPEINADLVLLATLKQVDNFVVSGSVP